jgi:hypothetical protein
LTAWFAPKTQSIRELEKCEVFSISDREDDIFEIDQAWQLADGGPCADWIMRANQDRALVNVVDGEPSLAEFIGIIGKLGGHLGRKSDGAPGPQSIWQGLARVRDFACAWHAFYGE